MSLKELSAFLRRSRRLFVITGAGVSAPSGIETYRDHAGTWRRTTPIQHQDFVRRPEARQRYWARSMRGWPSFRDARPNAAHRALAALEARGRLQVVVTQNVDGLHQKAGQANVVELHGNLARVVCLSCGMAGDREETQAWLEAHNPAWRQAPVMVGPDGDAEFLAVRQFADFRVPACQCGGVLKPDVVFYGDSVPRARVDSIAAALDRSDAVLVVGSSLMVYSSYRFIKAAKSRSLPLAAVNLGLTRADDWLDCKWEADSAEALPSLLAMV
ncbi:MAG: NAD-dependent protein deacetylase [Pseudomonadales bacterium]